MRQLIGSLIIVGIGTSCATNRGEAELQADRYGLDYVIIRENAPNDITYFRSFLLLGLVLDAAGTEQFASDLHHLLNTIGEEQFIANARYIKPYIRTEAYKHLADDAGYGQEGTSWAQFTSAYPKLTPLIMAEFCPNTR